MKVNSGNAQRDKAGNGFAILRFLPAPKGEEMPFVRIWDHGFQGALLVYGILRTP